MTLGRGAPRPSVFLTPQVGAEGGDDTAGAEAGDDTDDTDAVAEGLGL